MDSCEPDGYRCECDDKHFGKRCEHEISKYIKVYWLVSSQLY